MPQSVRAVTVACMAAVLIWTPSHPVLAQDDTLIHAAEPQTPSASVSSGSLSGSEEGPAAVSEVSELRAQIAGLKEALATAQRTRSSMAAECEAQRVSLDELTVRLSESEARVKRFRSQLMDFHHKSVEAGKTLDASQTEAEKWRTEYTMVERELGAIEKSNALLRERNEALEEDHTSATGRIEELGRHLVVALAERDAAQQALVDRDGDGIPNELDLCALSSDGVEVGATGCPKDAPIALQGVTFRLGSHQIADESTGVLDHLAENLRRHSSLRLEVAGHTDDRGDVVANLALSQRRAESVRAYLVGRGLPEDSLSARGYGPHEPISDNATASGRALNRRVELRHLPDRSR